MFDERLRRGRDQGRKKVVGNFRKGTKAMFMQCFRPAGIEQSFSVAMLAVMLEGRRRVARVGSFGAGGRAVQAGGERAGLLISWLKTDHGFALL